MNLFLYVLMPLLWIAVALLNWWLVYRRGWRRVLPVFSRYVVFSCVAAMVLWPLAWWSRYPVELQKIACLLYLYGYYIWDFVNAIFLLAVVHELLAFTIRARPEERRQLRTIFALGAAIVCAAATIRSLACTVWHSGGSQEFANEAGRIQWLMLIAMFLWVYQLKRKMAVPWGRNISLIVLTPALYFSVQIVLSFVSFKYGKQTPVLDVLNSIDGLVWPILWCLALRSGPELALSEG